MSQTQPPSGDDLTAVLDIVDMLEELVGGARRLPFTPSVVVNEEEILELVDRIRVALPDDLVSARHTVDERDQILERAEREIAEVAARAEEEAARLVREAQAQAASLIEEHAIVGAATEQARTLVADAEQRAADQRTAADDYAREVVQRLEEQLERWLGTVREGLQSLPSPPRARGRRRKG
jgi:alkanesulfonate monooxygenase SsuD/methylene tetrahydromethanopterin reductase-like flavin-dependent oxidoreductase (luciferase family)